MYVIQLALIKHFPPKRVDHKGQIRSKGYRILGKNMELHIRLTKFNLYFIKYDNC